MPKAIETDRPRRATPRTLLQLPLRHSPLERAALRAEAERRGCKISDLTRLALELILSGQIPEDIKR